MEDTGAVLFGRAHHSLILEHLQVRVDGAGARSPQAAAHFFQSAHDGVAVSRSILKRAEDGSSNVAAAHATSATPAASFAAPSPSAASPGPPGVIVLVFVMWLMWHVHVKAPSVVVVIFVVVIFVVVTPVAAVML